jgi:TonB family protein
VREPGDATPGPRRCEARALRRPLNRRRPTQRRSVSAQCRRGQRKRLGRGSASGVAPLDPAALNPRRGIPSRAAARRANRPDASLAANGRGRCLHRSSGDARLDEAALAGVRRWRYDTPPASADWNERWFVVPIEFHLQ